MYSKSGQSNGPDSSDSPDYQLMPLSVKFWSLPSKFFTSSISVQIWVGFYCIFSFSLKPWEIIMNPGPSSSKISLNGSLLSDESDLLLLFSYSTLPLQFDIIAAVGLKFKANGSPTNQVSWSSKSWD